MTFNKFNFSFLFGCFTEKNSNAIAPSLELRKSHWIDLTSEFCSFVIAKYEIIYELTGKCSCSCGIGTQWKEKKCVAYEQKNDKCEQVSTLTENCPRGGSRKYTIRCNNGDCGNIFKTFRD